MHGFAFDQRLALIAFCTLVGVLQAIETRSAEVGNSFETVANPARAFPDGTDPTWEQWDLRATRPEVGVASVDEGVPAELRKQLMRPDQQPLDDAIHDGCVVRHRWSAGK